jgi:hypothetical protein
MSFESLSALPAGILFALVTSITPGPNNTMLLTSGVNFGFRRTLPHVFGISAGVVLLMLCVGFGLGEAFHRFPALYSVLEIASVAYLLYLAWKIGTSGEVKLRNGERRPMKFYEAIASVGRVRYGHAASADGPETAAHLQHSDGLVARADAVSDRGALTGLIDRVNRASLYPRAR